MSDANTPGETSPPVTGLGPDELLRLHRAALELSHADSPEGLARRAVSAARAELGFDRVGLWMFDLVASLSHGTFGVDEQGALRDERERSGPIPADLVEAMSAAPRGWIRRESAELRNDRGAVVGRGTSVAAPVRDGATITGVVHADNLTSGRAIGDAQCDLLSLYASYLGSLYSRCRAEQALREMVARQSAFQDRLLTLHRVTTELSCCSSVDELYRRAIELGYEAFGRWRLGLWMLDRETDEQVGTYGIDEQGNLRDERASRRPVPPEGRLSRARRAAFRWDIERGVPLRNGTGQIVGTGASLCVPVWDGTRVLGALFADDLGSEATLTTQDAEILALYASSLGHMATRLYAEEERASLEMKLQHAQKMESVGRLAGGVAHDFNNLLTSLLGNASLALDALAPHDPVRIHLDAILVAGEAAAELTRKLLAFSRKQVIDPRVFDLNSVVGGMHGLLRTLIGEDIELRFRLDDGGGCVRMDPGQLEQLLVNLVVNARDAMPAGGVLTVSTGQAVVGEPIDEGLPGRYCTLTVSDTGVGMDSQALSHVFEPFYTTKEQGKGTGLGLATVYGIAAQNHGFVTVRSAPGQGSTFCVHLPCVPEPFQQPGPAERESAPAEAQAAETILLVEDDAMVRDLAAAALRRQGYTVVECAGPLEALARLEAQPDPIHLLLTDVVMPQMNGRDLSEHVRRMRPDVRVLFMSGYAEDVVAHSGVLEEEVNFIGKPFRLSALAQKVREVLDG